MGNEKIYTFDECLEKAKELKLPMHLLFGNGFSMAYDHNIFNYKSLYEKSKPVLTPELISIFKTFDSCDFESVIKDLTTSLKVIKLYDPTNKYISTIEENITLLKTQLITVLSDTHPDDPSVIDSQRKTNCSKFLDNFCALYTLNYDLLLYWINMSRLENNPKLKLSDGFHNNVDNEDQVIWDVTNDHSQNVFYMHGALHIYNTGIEYEKITWSKTGMSLKTQITEKINQEIFPLIVTEGTSKEKLAKIHSSGYLIRALKSLHYIKGALFIYGHSLAENDDHIFNKLSKKLEYIFISIYGDPNSNDNKNIKLRAESIKERFDISTEIIFYQAESANVWDNNTINPLLRT